ncbi:hypothetical protein V6N13_121832 [Hibiscus sabdariffa]|uniref:PGG domain-containing protein n=1 Tax=Hibiscus sabdariffa TaxID=183260 RepID=A0ABR2C634_9ROSI
MDESLRAAAHAGNVSELYTLIQRDGNVLRRFDEEEFIETPLHVAAAKGCIGFAMEIVSLKPTFARKLNKQGLSPIHLAVQKGHTEMAVRLLEIDSNLARVRGKNALRKKECYRETVNRKDEDGNTALHLAARNDQLEMVKLLLNCKADRQAQNLDGSTPLKLAEHHNSSESTTVLRGFSIPLVSNFSDRVDKQIIKYVRKASSLIFHDMENISEQDRNALLVILGLLLTATYQTSLSPPGGVWQGDSSSKRIGQRESPGSIGTAVMDEYYFLLFYSLTYVVSIVTYFLTLALLKPFPHGFRTALQVLLAFLAMCFDQSISYIAPTFQIAIILRVFSTITFVFSTDIP